MTKQEKDIQDIEVAREDEQDAEVAYKQALKDLDSAERWVRSRKVAWAEAIISRVEAERNAEMPTIQA